MESRVGDAVSVKSKVLLGISAAVAIAVAGVAVLVKAPPWDVAPLSGQERVLRATKVFYQPLGNPVLQCVDLVGNKAAREVTLPESCSYGDTLLAASDDGDVAVVAEMLTDTSLCVIDRRGEQRVTSFNWHGPVCGIAWTDTGSVAVIDASNQVWLWNGERDGPVRLSADAEWPPSFSPDRRYSLVDRWVDNSVYYTKLRIVGQNKTFELQEVLRSPSWSPDSDHLAGIVGHRGNQRVCIVECATGKLEATPINGKGGNISAVDYDTSGKYLIVESPEGRNDKPTQLVCWEIGRWRKHPVASPIRPRAWAVAHSQKGD